MVLRLMLYQGAASFVKKTVFGLSDSVTKFTSSVGKGMNRAGSNWIVANDIV